MESSNESTCGALEDGGEHGAAQRAALGQALLGWLSYWLAGRMTVHDLASAQLLAVPGFCFLEFTSNFLAVGEERT